MAERGVFVGKRGLKALLPVDGLELLNDGTGRTISSGARLYTLILFVVQAPPPPPRSRGSPWLHWALPSDAIPKRGYRHVRPI